MATEPQGQFPGFGEACEYAKNMEKRLLQPKRSQIGDSLALSESQAIFPAEFDEYTFNYLLLEAQKVEQKLAVSGYISQNQDLQQQAAMPQSVPAQDMQTAERELRNFASPISTLSMLKRNKEKKEAQMGIPAPPPRAKSTSIPTPPSLPKQESGETLLPPLPPKEGEVPPEVLEARGEKTHEEFAEPHEIELPPDETGQKPGILSSSKLSPRMRKLIEERMRKEDEKDETVDIERTPAPKKNGNAEKSDEEDIRLPFKKRAREEIAPEKEESEEESEEEIEKEGGGETPGEEQEAELPGLQPEKEEGEEEQESGEEKEGGGERAPKLPTKEDEGTSAEEKEGTPTLPAKEEEYVPRQVPKSAGGLTIKPIFSVKEAQKETAPAKEAAQEAGKGKRLRRIENILNELAPDKHKMPAVSMVEKEEAPPKKAGKKQATAAPETQAPLIVPREKPPKGKQQAKKKITPEKGPVQIPKRKAAAPPQGEEPAEEAPMPRKRVVAPPHREEPAPRRKMAPSVPQGEGQEEAPRQRAAAPPQEEEEAPTPKKRVLPQRTASVPSGAPRPRVLPGGVVKPGAPEMKTYVSPVIASIPKKVAEEEKKAPAEEAPEEQQTPQKSAEEIARERKMAKMEEQLAKIEAQKSRDITGEAAIPQKDEPDVPLPQPEEKAEAKPKDYEEAKEGFKQKMDKVEIVEKTREADEHLLEEYAKENMVWLYEIYNIGGIAREEFLEKVREYRAGQAEREAESPPNPALANLEKEIEKDKKKK